MPLPIAGDTRRALRAMDARTKALFPDAVDVVHAGDVSDNTERLGGPGGDAMRLMWGDLLDVEEFMLEFGVPAVRDAMGEAIRSQDPFSVMCSIVAQTGALAVLMERQRWEAQRDRKAAKG